MSGCSCRLPKASPPPRAQAGPGAKAEAQTPPGDDGSNIVPAVPPARVVRIPDPKKRSPEEEQYVPPKLTNRVLPVYPYELLRKGVSGKARVGCIIDDNGRVTSTSVMEATRPEFGAALAAAVEACDFASATDPAFGYAAVQAVARWRFEPATADGKPALMCVHVPFRFIPPNRVVFETPR